MITFEIELFKILSLIALDSLKKIVKMRIKVRKYFFEIILSCKCAKFF